MPVTKRKNPIADAVRGTTPAQAPNTYDAEIEQILRKVSGIEAQPAKSLPFRVIDFLSGGLTDPDTWIGATENDAVKQDLLSRLSGLLNPPALKGGAMAGAMAMVPRLPRIANPIRAYHASKNKFNAERLIRWPNGQTEYIVGKPEALPNVPADATVVADYPLGRLRLDKMGTGAGRQDHGRGIYLAENKNSADAYREFPGSLYEVNLHADPNDFLHLDRPLADQHPSILEKLRRAGIISDGPDPSELDVRPDASWIPESQLKNVYGDSLRDQLTSASMHRALSRNRKVTQQKSADFASRVLKQLDIPGFRYLPDRFLMGARFTPDKVQQHNYVVTDEKIVELVKKLGIAAAVGAGLINEGQARQLQAQGYE